VSLVPGTSIATWLPPALRDVPGSGEASLSSARLLDALLAAVDTQYRLLAADIDQVWEDLFVESCAPWVVPYLAVLVGLPSDAERAEVAYAIALRRRKGTPGALCDFAEVLTAFSARVVEGWQVTLWSQRLGYPPPPRAAALSLADVAASRVGTPFDRARRSFTPGGNFDPAAATAVVWPWRVFTYRGTQAVPVSLPSAPSTHRYALHPLGVPAPLYIRPRPLSLSAEDLAASGGPAPAIEETGAPVRVTRRLIEALAGPGDLSEGGTRVIAPSHPLASSQPGDPPMLELSVGGSPIPWSSLRFGPLPPGAAAPFPPAAGQAVVDVDQGMVELAGDLAGSGPLRAVWHRPAPGGIGALAATTRGDLAARIVVRVNPMLAEGPGLSHSLAGAIALAQALEQSSKLVADPRSSRPDVEIRLETSDRLAVPPGTTSITSGLPRWRIVASLLSTPTLVGDLAIDLPGGTLSIEGLYVSGSLTVGPATSKLLLRNVTIDPTRGAVVSVLSGGSGGSVETALVAERCLLAPIQAGLGASVIMTDCLVDGRGHRLDEAGSGGPPPPPRPAVSSTAGARFGPDLQASGVTFAGQVQVDAIEATDCLFADGLQVVQRQRGCLRHCYLGPSPELGSLPPAYRCGPFPAPTFSSVAFEAAGYYALELASDQPLLSAAGDGGEVGAYHHARRAIRLAALRRRIHEFVPLGIDALVALAPWEE